MTKDLEALIRRNELAQERFKDLEEYFGGSKSILEDRKEFKKWLERGEQAIEKVDEMESKLEQQPSDSVSLGVYKQIVWERDIAIEQLKELGYSFGEKIRTSDDCVSRKDVLEMFGYESTIYDLPPVTPTEKKDDWIPLVWDEYPTVDSDGNDDYVYAVDYSVPMPNEDEWVLITDENHNVVKVQYDGYDFGDYARENILAWQPLPKAYEDK